MREIVFTHDASTLGFPKVLVWVWAGSVGDQHLGGSAERFDEPTAEQPVSAWCRVAAQQVAVFKRPDDGRRCPDGLPRSVQIADLGDEGIDQPVPEPVDR